MSSNWGRNIRLAVFGESHGPAVGCVIDSLPAGFVPDMDQVRYHMARRGAGGKPWATARMEADAVEIQSGMLAGKLTGAPLCALIRNNNTRSGDYGAAMTLPRPGHADYTAHVRYSGHEDFRGGGHFSGRLTAPLVFAGALAMQLLAQRGVVIGAHLSRIGTVADRRFDSAAVTAELLNDLTESAFPTLDECAAAAMIAEIQRAKEELDSVGGEVELAVLGLPAGVGSPMMDGLESAIASLLFSVPAIKGLEFGDGFALSSLRGSQANDAYIARDGKIRTNTNHNGGILGGISTGMPLLLRAALKPTPSIAQSQRTVNLSTGAEETLAIRGRHDPCIAPRALVAIEAAVALAILDCWMDIDSWRQP